MSNKIEEKILQLAQKANISKLIVCYNGKKVSLQRFFTGQPEVSGEFIRGYSLLLCNSRVEDGNLLYRQGNNLFNCHLETEEGVKIPVTKIIVPVVQWFDKQVKSQELINEFFSGSEESAPTAVTEETVSELVFHTPNEKYEAIKLALEKAGYEEQVHENYRFFNSEEPILIIIKEEGFDELEHSKESSEGDNLAFIGGEEIVQVTISEGKVENIQKVQFEKK